MTTTSTQTIATLYDQCRRDAAREWGVDPDEYTGWEATAGDMEWIIEQLGRKPTLVEWREALGPRVWVGDAHCSADE